MIFKRRFRYGTYLLTNSLRINLVQVFVVADIFILIIYSVTCYFIVPTFFRSNLSMFFTLVISCFQFTSYRLIPSHLPFVHLKRTKNLCFLPKRIIQHLSLHRMQFTIQLTLFLNQTSLPQLVLSIDCLVYPFPLPFLLLMCVPRIRLEF